MSATFLDVAEAIAFDEDRRVDFSQMTSRQGLAIIFNEDGSIARAFVFATPELTKITFAAIEWRALLRLTSGILEQRVTVRDLAEDYSNAA